MSEKPGWKKALSESNAIGWIGFLLLVIAIGAGTLYFGSSSGSGPAKAPISQAAK